MPRYFALCFAIAFLFLLRLLSSLKRGCPVVYSRMQPMDDNPEQTRSRTNIENYGIALAKTTLACLGAAVITYPADRHQAKWKSQSLSQWAEEDVHVPHKSVLRLFSTPLIRLTLHEMMVTALASQAEQRIFRNEMLLSLSPLSKELMAGTVAGVCQAMLLCPLETHRALERMKNERQREKSWLYYLRRQWGGGTLNPQERLARAYKGVGLLAIREVVFNLSFFPLFFQLRRYQLQHNLQLSSSPSPPADSRTLCYNFSAALISGVLAGCLSAAVVAPMDVLRLYFWYSGERYSIFFGRQVWAPPWQLLTRGWGMQAVVYGPTFGVIAAIASLSETS